MKRVKVLWFSPTPSMYGKNTVYHNGGGWVASLEKLLRDCDQINLAIAFEHDDNKFKIIKEKVTYYPIDSNRRLFQKIKIKLGFAEESDALIKRAIEIINDYKPDIIHVFGSENSFGLIAKYVNIPVVIHLQGSLPSYFNARFPPGYSWYDFILMSKMNPYIFYRLVSNDQTFLKRSNREKKILNICNHFMGRTEWDRIICQTYNPKATYYHCSEVMRSEFYTEINLWKPRTEKKIIIVSTLSSPLYKGSDVVLKTAFLLKYELKYDIEWIVYGLSSIDYHEKKLGIKRADVNIKLMGICTAEEIKDSLLLSDVYVHPSYIDNSPNSLCEAQILGVPTIATFVGGVPSLISNGENGVLVPANDPYTMAYNIIKIKNDSAFAIKINKKSFETANTRHCPSVIGKEIISIYKKILKW